MGIVVVVLSILYLCGFHIGTALAICAIIEVILASMQINVKMHFE